MTNRDGIKSEVENKICVRERQCKGGNKTSMAGRNVRVISSLNKKSMSSRNNIRKKLRVMRHINTTSRVKILSVT